MLNEPEEEAFWGFEEETLLRTVKTERVQKSEGFSFRWELESGLPPKDGSTTISSPVFEGGSEGKHHWKLDACWKTPQPEPPVKIAVKERKPISAPSTQSQGPFRRPSTTPGVRKPVPVSSQPPPPPPSSDPVTPPTTNNNPEPELLVKVWFLGHGPSRSPPTTLKSIIDIKIVGVDGKVIYTATARPSFAYGISAFQPFTCLNSSADDGFRIQVKIQTFGSEEFRHRNLFHVFGNAMPGASGGRIFNLGRNIVLPEQTLTPEGRALGILTSLYESGTSTDLVILAGVEKTPIPCHKMILSGSSPVFQRMLTSQMIESSTSEVAIPDFDPEIVRGLIEFIYTQKTPRMDLNAPELLQIADKYGINCLKSECESVIARSLHLDNAIQMLMLADLLNAEMLKKDAMNFISSHKTVLKEMGAFSQLEGSFKLLLELYTTEKLTF